MKKFLIAASLLFAALSANAADEIANYKPEAGRLSVELGFNPFTDKGAYLENGVLNGKYDFNSKWAVRVGLGWNATSTTDASDIDGTNNSFSIIPGFVYSFSGTPRFTPYIGGELSCGFGKKEYDDNETAKSTSFGIHAFTGMNYYFAQHLYVGVEFGIGYDYEKETTYTYVGSVKTSSKTKEGTFAPYAQPAIRLGWTF